MPVHISVPALNTGRCGAVNRDARTATAGNPGLCLWVLVLTGVPPNRQPLSWNQKLHRHLFRPA